MIGYKTEFPSIKEGLSVLRGTSSSEDLKDLELLIAAKKSNGQKTGIPLSEAKKELLKKDN